MSVKSIGNTITMNYLMTAFAVILCQIHPNEAELNNIPIFNQLNVRPSGIGRIDTAKNATPPVSDRIDTAKNITSSTIGQTDTTKKVVVLKRSKRNYVQFAEMIRYATGREPLLYNKYGNYCGWKRGSGPVLDDVDRCCFVHDNCYGKADEGTLCKSFIVYIPFITYRWRKENDRIVCLDKHPCPRFVCDCDRETSECFARHEYDRFRKKPSWLDIFIAPSEAISYG